MHGKWLLGFVQTQLICTCLKIETRPANHRGNWNARWVLGRRFNRDVGLVCRMLGCMSGWCRFGGGGCCSALNNPLDPQWGSVWLRPGRSAAVASLHSTESAKLHQPTSALLRHARTRTHTHTICDIFAISQKHTYLLFLYAHTKFLRLSINSSPPIPPGHNHFLSHISHAGR